MEKASLSCSRDVIRRWLVKEGIQHRLALRRPFLSAENARTRKSFCKRYLQEDESFWYSWWFTDEVSIDRTDGDYTKWSFYRIGERLHRDKVQPRRQAVRHSKMFHGSINYDKPSPLVPLNGDPEAKRGGVTGRVIKACLQSYVPGLAEEGETFQHDNARTYKARVVQNWLRHWARREGVLFTDWPPYSPDLNPIENIWHILKKRIYARYPEIADYPKSVEALNRLIEAAEELWDEITDDEVKDMIKSVPRRIRACYNANGHYTKY
ncbi:hypothetical protein ACKAV7_014663 [Fusarium commune]